MKTIFSISSIPAGFSRPLVLVRLFDNGNCSTVGLQACPAGLAKIQVPCIKYEVSEIISNVL